MWLPNWLTSPQLGDNFMNEQTKKTHTVICPVSVEYKIILEPQQTFKSDGVVSKGKRVYFRGGRAEVDTETLEKLKQLPEWGVDFVEAGPNDIKPAEPIRPTATGLGTEMDKELQKGKMETLEKKMDLLTEAMAQIVENMTKNK